MAGVRGRGLRRPGLIDATRPLRRAAAAGAAALLLLAAAPDALRGQQPLRAPSGVELDVPRDTLTAMLRETRAYRDTLVQDPDVLYYTGFSAAVTDSAYETALPWNAIEVRSDSVARVATPGNLREGDRAYSAYAVARMEAYRAREPDGSPSCRERMAGEVDVLEAFARGWTVARIYYGAPPYPPLDEIAFLHRRGMLAPYLASRAPARLGPCAEQWAAEHPDAMEAYREWRRREFLGEPRASDRPSGPSDRDAGPTRFVADFLRP